MIRAVLLGRTGNNLFQYAMGRVLAERHDTELVMDGSWFRASDWKEVSCLQRLGLKAHIRRGFSWYSRGVRKLTGRHLWQNLNLPVIGEEDGDHAFHEAFLQAPKDCVLMGYFQSPRYFASLEKELREELDLSRLSWSQSTLSMADRLEADESVAIHVRRKDFVGRAEFDLCGVDYYTRAMRKMREGLKAPHFHVFSDDPAWAQNQFGGSDVSVCDLSEEKGNPLHDMFLMSRARHHIIANSSYSWWGAWMGAKAGQQVIAPDRWLGGGIHAPMEDKLCEGWETVCVNESSSYD